MFKSQEQALKSVFWCIRYAYQLSPLYANRSCGGADMWAGVSQSAGIFCGGGYFCPSTTEKLECEAGYDNPCLATSPLSCSYMGLQIYFLLELK